MATERSIFDRLLREVRGQPAQVIAMRQAFAQWLGNWDAGEHTMFSSHLENILDQRRDERQFAARQQGHRRGRSEFEPRSVFVAAPLPRHRKHYPGEAYHSHPSHPHSHPVITKHRRTR